MAIITLAEAQSWLVDTPSEDETIITTLISAAETYLVNATGNLFADTDGLAKLICLVLVTDWYENRELIGKVSEKVRPIISSILTQLKYSYPLIQTPALPDALVGANYSAAIIVEGGTEPYTWSYDTLPEGLVLNERTGILSGIATTAGTVTIAAEVTDSCPIPKTATRSILITVVGI